MIDTETVKYTNKFLSVALKFLTPRQSFQNSLIQGGQLFIEKDTITKLLNMNDDAMVISETPIGFNYLEKRMDTLSLYHRFELFSQHFSRML